MEEMVREIGRTVRYALASNPRTARFIAILLVGGLTYALVT